MKLFLYKTREGKVGQHQPSSSSSVRIWRLCLSENGKPQCATYRALATSFPFRISAPFSNLYLNISSRKVFGVSVQRQEKMENNIPFLY